VTHEYVLLVGGRIVPGGDAPEAEAVAWAHDTILAIGPEAAVRAISRGDSTVHDLGGAWVVPLDAAGAFRWPPAVRLDVGGRADLAVYRADPRPAGPGASPDPAPTPAAVVRGGHVVAGTLPPPGRR
jgi:cytosine/adenosine deaminase-related metal-dependent hydrolase